MKRIALFIFLIMTIFLNGCTKKGSMDNNAYSEAIAHEYETTMKRDILCLMMAYPEYICDVDVKNGNVYIVMKSGRKIVYDDKKTKGFDEKISNPDLQDMMEQIYPLSDIDELMLENFDPGRGRVYSLFKEVYGGTKGEVQSNLINVRTGYGSSQFNKNNNAAQSLKNAMSEIASLSKGNHKIAAAAFPTNGTFNYRMIAGTNRLSPHSFGTAIDLARDKRDYWKWASRKEGQARLSVYPREIVKAFEKNNFIWGGKWGHFDILHFEYRPELIFKSKYFSEDVVKEQSWYYGVQVDENIKKCIELIDSRLN